MKIGFTKYRMSLCVCIAVVCTFLLASFTAFAAESAPVAAKAKWPPHLRFLSGPNGGQWFHMGEPIAEVLTKNVISASARIGGGVSNITDVSQKKGDLGFSLACVLGAALSGEAEYKKIQADNTVLLNNVYPQVLYFLLRKDFATKNNIATVGDLLNLKMPLRFASLKPGTASEFILNMLLKYSYSSDFDKLRSQGWSITLGNYSEIADKFVAGDIDCFAYTAGTVVPLILTMETHTEMVVLPVDQKALDTLSAKFKTTTYTIPQGVYKSVTTPTKTLGDYACIIVRKDLPEDLVFAVAKALWENKKQVAGVIADFDGLSPKTALLEGLPTHPGAEKFWNSVK